MTQAPTSQRRPDAAALVIGALLLALAVVVAWDAANLRTGAATYSRIGPQVFPYGVAICLAILGVATLASAVLKPVPAREPERLAPLLWIIGGLVLQIAALPFLGFSIATGAVFAGTARAFGRGPLWFTYPVGVVLSLIVWLVFALALKLVLPAGFLENAAAGPLRSLLGL